MRQPLKKKILNGFMASATIGLLACTVTSAAYALSSGCAPSDLECYCREENSDPCNPACCDASKSACCSPGCDGLRAQYFNATKWNNLSLMKKLQNEVQDVCGGDDDDGGEAQDPCPESKLLSQSIEPFEGCEHPWFERFGLSKDHSYGFQATAITHLPNGQHFFISGGEVYVNECSVFSAGPQIYLTFHEGKVFTPPYNCQGWEPYRTNPTNYEKKVECNFEIKNSTGYQDFKGKITFEEKKLTTAHVLMCPKKK